MKRILVDMDDVLAQTSERLVEIYNKEFGHERKVLSFENFRQSIHEFPSIDNDLRKYLFESGFFRSLIPKPNSIEVLKKIYEKHDVYIVSAAIEFPLSLQEKIDWLDEHFGFIHWKKIVFCGDKSVTTGDCMIDDLTINLDNFSGEKILFAAPHNIDEGNYKRVTNWIDVYNIFFS